MAYEWSKLQMELLNKGCPRKKVQKDMQGFEYLPISFMQRVLDTYFPLMWKEELERVDVVANEILVAVKVSVYNKDIQQWVSRVGTGAALIQQAKGAQITDLNAKYKNSLQKDYPNAHARAFRNACKGLGNIFGRNLNRRHHSEDTPFRVMSVETVGTVGTVEEQSAPAPVHAPAQLPERTIQSEIERICIETDSKELRDELGRFYKAHKSDFTEQDVALIQQKLKLS